MYLLYSLLFTLGFVVLLPRFLFDALRHGKYVAGFRERLGTLPAIESDGRPVVWLHCVSVGETQAALPLIRVLRRRFPDYLIAISTVTLTGQNLARQVFKNDATRIFYFPFDWRWTARRALKAINPSLVLLMETELWPGFLRECRSQQVRVAIVNGRLSETSFRRYKLVPGFISRVVNCVDLALMQTESDADRIRSLGLKSNCVFVSGSLKFDAEANAETNSLTEAFRDRFGFSHEVLLILAVSTHAPEERIILAAYDRVRSMPGRENARLLIAPRHPERFAEVASLLKSSTFPWVQRTDQPSPEDRECDVLLLDTIGELRSIFSLASIVFVGGSIAPAGGHNILEPAAAGSCIVTGSHTENFKDIVETFAEADAIVQLPALSEAEAANTLTTVFDQLFDDPERRRALGARARTLVEQNRGASERSVDLLTKMISVAGRANESDTPSAAREEVHPA
jgi:3-deoxy-D-manno-octulosonic-acid transferase